MSNTIKYNGFVLEPVTRLREKAKGWSLAVHITPIGRRTGMRRCRAPNIYASEEAAILHCLEFGRRIVDGKMEPRSDQRA